MTESTSADTAGTDASPAIAPKTHPCNCQLGWRGSGLGSERGNHRLPCDKITTRAFAQGHDARMASRLATEVAEGLIDTDTATEIIGDAGGSRALVSKTLRSAQLRAKAAERKAVKRATGGASVTVERVASDSDSDDLVEPETAGAAGNESGDFDDIVVASVAPGDVVEVTHGRRNYRAVATELPSGLRLVHDIKGEKSCVHELNGAFLVTVGRIDY